MNSDEIRLNETATRRATVAHDDVVSSDDPRVTRAVEEYLLCLEQGEHPNRDDFLAIHPDIAAPLSECLDALELIYLTAGRLELDEADQWSPKVGAPIGVLGDFRILREIGRGGMGVVYEAQQISLSRRVALKVLPFASMLDARQLKRFKNEAMAAAQLDHPNIVDIYGTGCERGIHYYAMQCIEGETLADAIGDLRGIAERKKLAQISQQSDQIADERSAQTVLGRFKALDRNGVEPDVRGSAAASRSSSNVGRKRDPLPDTSLFARLTTEQSPNRAAYFPAVANIGLQLAEALSYAHSVGIVHRDIKPSNLLLDSTGHVWIADFGIAQIETDVGLTMTGDVLGTLRYMSPEQASGEKRFVGHRTDIYSLGITLYELSVLRPAFSSDDRQRLFGQVIHDDPPQPRSINPSIPPDLETIILKSISKEPAERYADAADMADDLRRFLEQKPIKAKRPSAWERAAKWSQRKRKTLVVAMIFLAVLSVTSAVGMFTVWREQSRTKAALGEARENSHFAKQQQRRAEALAAQVRRQLYVADMKLAHQAWSNADLVSAERILDRYLYPDGQQDVRGYEWHHLRNLCRGTALTASGFEGEVYHVAYSPDCKQLAGAGQDGTVRLWDSSTGDLLTTLKGHQGEVSSVSFSPDGGTLVSSGDDQTVRLWNTQTTEQIAVLRGHTAAVTHALFSPDGALLATAGRDAVIRLWDTSTREQVAVLKGETGVIEHLAISPDGLTLAAAGSLNAQALVNLWDLRSQKFKTQFKLDRRSGVLLTACFSPDGRWLATAGTDQTIRLWDLDFEEELIVMRGHSSWVQDLTFLPDGKTLISAGRDSTIRFWDVLSGQEKGTLKEHRGRLWSVAVSADGDQLATTSADRTIKLWNLPLILKRGRFPLDPSVRFVSLSPGGRHVCAHQGDQRKSGITIWNTTTQAEIAALNYTGENTISCLAVTSDGITLAAGGKNGDFQIRSVRSGRFLHELDAPELDTAVAAAFSPDGSLLATSNSMTGLRVWNVASVSLLADVRGHSGIVTEVAFSPDGRFLASASDDFTAKIWGVPSFSLLSTLRGHKENVLSVAFSHDGALLITGGKDRTVRIWNVATGEEEHVLLGHTSSVTAVACSPYDRTLATADADGVIRLWNSATRQEFFAMKGHSLPITDLAFSPDGERLFSCAKNEAPGGPVECLVWPDAARMIRK